MSRQPPVAAVLLALGLVASPSGAQPHAAPPTLDLVKQPPLQERVAPTEVNAVLARRAVYGLVAGPLVRPVPFPTREAGHPQVWIGGLQPGDRVLCVELARAQGGYEARFTVRLPRAGDAVRVPFDSSDEARRLFAAGATAAELVVRARADRDGSCDDAGPLLPAALDMPPAGTPELHLAVGGAGKGVPAVRVNGQPQRDCLEIGRLLERRDFGANVYGYLCPVAAAGEACRPKNVARVLWLEGSMSNDEVDIQFRRRCDAAR